MGSWRSDPTHPQASLTPLWKNLHLQKLIIFRNILIWLQNQSDVSSVKSETHSELKTIIKCSQVTISTGSDNHRWLVQCARQRLRQLRIVCVRHSVVVRVQKRNREIVTLSRFNSAVPFWSPGPIQKGKKNGSIMASSCCYQLDLFNWTS